MLMIFPLREENTGETAAPIHLLEDHSISFATTSHMLVLMVHAGESQSISVHNFPQGWCGSVPFTVFDLGFAEVLVGLNSAMSVCSCLVSMPHQEDKPFSLRRFWHGLSRRSVCNSKALCKVGACWSSHWVMILTNHETYI